MPDIPLRVQHVDKPFLGYFTGMNAHAAKSLGIQYPYDKNTVVVVKGLSKREEKNTIEHEKREVKLMRSGQTYRQAHAHTLLAMGEYKERDAAFRNSDLMIAHSASHKEETDHPKILKPVQVKPAKTEEGRKRQVWELRHAAKRERGYAKTADGEYHSETALARKKSGVESEDLRRDAQVAKGFTKDRKNLADSYDLQAARIAAVKGE